MESKIARSRSMSFSVRRIYDTPYRLLLSEEEADDEEDEEE